MKRIDRTLFLLVTTLFFTMTAVQAQVLADGQPSVLKEDQNPPNYVHDLKLLIKKSRENIKNVDVKIKEQAVVKRNQKREEKAREYYEQAIKLREEGRLEEARQLFDKAIRITEHPEMHGYIKESESRAKTQEHALKKETDDQERRLTEEEKVAFQQAEDSYQIAVSLYKQQKFKEARTAFEAVEEMSPDYKAVRSYLQIVDQDIAQQDNLSMKEQRKEIEYQQKGADISRLREKELWRKEIEQKEEDRKNQLKKQADEAYNAAIKLYQDRKYQAAKDKFQEVEWVVPDFKATRAYLGRIDRDIEGDRKRIMSEREKELEKQRWDETLAERKQEEERKNALQAKDKARLEQNREQAEFIYTAALATFNKNDFAQAKEKFDEVEALYPDYKSTRTYLKKLGDLLGLQPQEATVDEPTDIAGKSPEEQQKILTEEAARRKAEKEKFRKISVEVEDAFNEARTLYSTGRLIESKEKFLAVDQQVPDYKSAREYLKRIDEDIELLAKTHKREGAFSDQQAELDTLKALKEKASKLYSLAQSSFDARDFVRARSEFQEVEAILPDFKRTKSYLQRIDDEVARQEEEFKRKGLENQASIAYAQAVVLYNTGQFEEAKKKLIEVDAILPNYKDITNYLERIDDDIIAKKEKDLAHLRELQVEGPYAEALVLYQNQDFEGAKARFLEVVALYSDYKDTAKFLDKIDADIEKQKLEKQLREKTEKAETFYKQAVESYQAGDFAVAKDKFVRLEVVWPDYKDTSRYLGRIDDDITLKKQKDDLARRADEAQPLYDQALSLYKEQEFPEAKKKFMQVQVLYPGFRDTALYLSRVEKDIQSQEERVVRLEQSRKAEGFYTQAVNLYAERKFEDAKKKFLEVVSVDPGYKNLRSYLGRIDGDIRSEAAHQELLTKEQLAEEPYSQAVTIYHDRDFMSAKEKFLETSRILPDYKKTRSYLSRIDKDISEEKRQTEQAKVEKAVFLYREAQAFSTENKLAEALAKFSELEACYPDYKNTRALLADIRSRLGVKDVPVAMPQVPADELPKAAAMTGGLLSEDKIFELYKEAVVFYKEKNYQDARARFEKIASSRSKYRSTEKYLDSIDAILGTKKGPVPTVKVAHPAPLAAGDNASLAAKAEPFYHEAVQLYKDGKYDIAKTKFEQADSILPDYKESRKYLILIAKAQGKTVKPSAIPEQSAKDAEAVRELSRRSEAIYRQIKALSQDKEMTSALRTFAQVDRIISDLEAEQKRLEAQAEEQQRLEREAVIRQKKEEKAAEALNARKAKAETEKLRREDIEKLAEKERGRSDELKTQGQAKDKEQQKETDLKAETFYQQALSAYKDKKYDETRSALSELAKLRPNYKDSTRILTRLDREESEAKLVQQENNDRKVVADLAERANAVNLEVVKLTEQRNYDEVRKKFDDLSGILREIQGVKDRMMSRRRELTSIWEGRAAKSSGKRLAQARSPEKFLSELDSRIAKKKARSIFREGQQLYSAQSYPEAKAKFLEAYSLDPNLSAASTYINRVNRLVEQRDFEGQKTRNQRESRKLESKSEAREGLAAETADEKTLSDEERAKLLLDSGTELYRGKRYREARIKFEELVQIGDVKQSGQAKRYLALIDKAMQEEKEKTERERQTAQGRYLRERRDQDRLTSVGDRSNQSASGAKDKSRVKAERELEISRQQELRVIEQENMSERERVISEKATQDGLAVHEDKAERSKFRKISAKVDNKAEEKAAVAVSGAEEVRKEPQKEVQAAESPEVVPEAKEVVPKKDAPQPSLEEVRAEREKARKEEARRKQAERKRADLTKQEEKYRRELEQAQIKLVREKELFEKSQREQERLKGIRLGEEASRIETKQEDVLEKSKMTSTVGSSPVEQPVAVSIQGGHGTDLRGAIADEKRLLEQQRAAIRQDFDEGVAKLYEEAVELFKKRLYEEAQQDFFQVRDMIKDYNKTDYYLERIEKILNSSRKKLSVKAYEPISQPVTIAPKADAVFPVPTAGREKTVSQALDTLDGSVRH